MGRVIEGLGGRYITADDVGTTLADLAVMREVTSHTAGATAAAQAPLAVTAYGVLMAIEAAVQHYYQRDDFAGPALRRPGAGQCRLSPVRLPARARCRARGQRRRSGACRPGRRRARRRGGGARGDLRPARRRVRAVRARRRAQRPDHPAPARAPGLRRGQQPARRAAPRRGAGGARHRLRAGLSGQCRRRHRLPPGSDRRQPGGRAGLGRAHPRHHPRRAARAPRPAARHRSRWPTGSCATASAPQA